MKLLKIVSLLWHAVKEIEVKLCASELIIKYKSLSLYINNEDLYVKVERDITIDCDGYLSLCPPEGFNAREYKYDAEYLHPERNCCGDKERSRNP